MYIKFPDLFKYNIPDPCQKNLNMLQLNFFFSKTYRNEKLRKISFVMGNNQSGDGIEVETSTDFVEK